MAKESLSVPGAFFGELVKIAFIHTFTCQGMMFEGHVI
jgi:hypothetical protein